MTYLVSPAELIECVGVPRHHQAHYGRAVSDEQTVYILHSQQCLASGVDLRECRFSVALDRGIRMQSWSGFEDMPVVLGIWHGRLIPLAVAEVWEK